MYIIGTPVNRTCLSKLLGRFYLIIVMTNNIMIHKLPNQK